MKNLVTGATGFVGSHVAEKLKDAGEKVSKISIPLHVLLLPYSNVATFGIDKPSETRIVLQKIGYR